MVLKGLQMVLKGPDRALKMVQNGFNLGCFVYKGTTIRRFAQIICAKCPLAASLALSENLTFLFCGNVLDILSYFWHFC